MHTLSHRMHEGCLYFVSVFMDENMDEMHCNYFHGGYVFSLMTHRLLIKTGNI